MLAVRDRCSFRSTAEVRGQQRSLPEGAYPVVDPRKDRRFEDAGEIRCILAADRRFRVCVRKRVNVVPRTVRLLVSVPPASTSLSRAAFDVRDVEVAVRVRPNFQRDIGDVRRIVVAVERDDETL